MAFVFELRDDTTLWVQRVSLADTPHEIPRLDCVVVGHIWGGADVCIDVVGEATLRIDVSDINFVLYRSNFKDTGEEAKEIFGYRSNSNGLAYWQAAAKAIIEHQ